MFHAFYVPQNLPYGIPKRGYTVAFKDQKEFDTYVAIHFNGGSILHYLPCGKFVHGYKRYLQEYDPTRFNDTANRLFDKNGIEEYPGNDCGGILGNVLFF